jgi:hypothetical protein
MPGTPLGLDNRWGFLAVWTDAQRSRSGHRPACPSPVMVRSSFRQSPAKTRASLNDVSMETNQQIKRQIELWAVELDLVGPVGCRSRRAQAVVGVAENAEKLARRATAAGEPCTTADELLDLRGQVQTEEARKLVGEALEYVVFGETLRLELNRGAFRKAPAGLGL